MTTVDGYQECISAGMTVSDFEGHCPTVGHQKFAELILQKARNNKRKN